MVATLPDGSAPGLFGVYPGIVTKIIDDAGLGRVQVRFPWLTNEGDRDVRAWARLCSPYADETQGLEILPEVDSEVVVAFAAGNLRSPYVIGAVWNGKAKLPQPPAVANNIRVLRTRGGSQLEFDDTAGAEKVTLTTQQGHRLVLDQAASEVTVKHALGCTITLKATQIDIDANIELNITAPMVNVDAAVSTFSGVVKASTFTADAFVISPAYTPGVGNIW